MKILDFEIIDNLPALYCEKIDSAIITDLHLGLEGSLTSKGNYVPEEQLEEIKDNIVTIDKMTDADKLIINGDIKTEFSKNTYAERKEIEEFFNHVLKYFRKIIVVRGNHDTFIESVIDSERIKVKEHYLEEKILFVHGHEKIDEEEIEENYETIVIGHEHPALALRDDIGVKEKIDCFLFGDTKDGRHIMVMPAFSQVSQGTNINEIPKRELLSPILKEKVDVDKLEAIGISREAGIFPIPEIGKI